MGFDKEQRHVIFARANASCEVCGASWDSGVMLECHHIIPLSDGGANHVNNGKLLCRPCHANAHLQIAKKAKKMGNKRSEKTNMQAYKAIRMRSKMRWGF